MEVPATNILENKLGKYPDSGTQVSQLEVVTLASSTMRNPVKKAIQKNSHEKNERDEKKCLIVSNYKLSDIGIF